MDSDRVTGKARQVKGSVKEAIGKLTGNAEAQAEGAAEQAEGKIQSAAAGTRNVVQDAASEHHGDERVRRTPS